MCHDVISSATSAQFGDCYTNDRELNLQNALVDCLEPMKLERKAW